MVKVFKATKKTETNIFCTEFFNIWEKFMVNLYHVIYRRYQRWIRRRCSSFKSLCECKRVVCPKTMHWKMCVNVVIDLCNAQSNFKRQLHRGWGKHKKNCSIYDELLFVTTFIPNSSISSIWISNWLPLMESTETCWIEACWRNCNRINKIRNCSSSKSLLYKQPCPCYDKQAINIIISRCIKPDAVTVSTPPHPVSIAQTHSIQST